VRESASAGGKEKQNNHPSVCIKFGSSAVFMVNFCFLCFIALPVFIAGGGGLDLLQT